MREVHGNVYAGSWSHVETHGARPDLFAERDLVFRPILFDIEVFENFFVASVAYVDGFSACNLQEEAVFAIDVIGSKFIWRCEEERLHGCAVLFAEVDMREL